MQQRTYSELLVAMLVATIAGDDDELMGLRAETMARFRRSDAQVEAALFKLHTQREVGGKATQAPESLDLSRISGMDWLIEGFIPDNDQTLLWVPRIIGIHWQSNDIKNTAPEAAHDAQAHPYLM